MRNMFKTLSVGLTIFLTGCNTPVAPTQPEDGVISNYRTNRFSNRVTGIIQGQVTTANDGTVSVNNIPFFKQGKDNTCGQATITSILNFWGVDIDYQTVINESNPLNLATDIGSVEAYIKIKNLNVTTKNNSTIKELEALIDEGKPPMVLVDFGGLSYEHYIVVSGYNERKKTMLINDPRNGANLSIKQSDFLEIWKNKSLGNLLIFGDRFYRPIIAVSSKE